MRTRKFLMALTAILMGSQVALFAQEKKESGPERKRLNKEQIQEMQCNQIIQGLALDDATAAKFAPVYKQYMEEMQATRRMGGHRNVANRTATNKQTLKPIPTDAEVEQTIKERFAQSRKILDIREKYYEEYRKFLSPKQIQKMYNMEKCNGDKFRKEMKKRQGMRNRHDGKKRVAQGDMRKNNS